MCYLEYICRPGQSLAEVIIKKLVLEIRVSQNLARLAGKPIKCQGWEGVRELE